GAKGDPMLLDYVSAAHERTHALAEIANRYLGHTMIGNASTMDLPFARPLQEAAKYGCEPAHVAWLIEDRLSKRLDDGSRYVYENIEMPLVPVLADMET